MVAAGIPKGEKIQPPEIASAANTGKLNADAHKAVQVAWDALA